MLAIRGVSEATVCVKQDVKVTGNSMVLEVDSAMAAVRSFLRAGSIKPALHHHPPQLGSELETDGADFVLGDLRRGVVGRIGEEVGG